MALHLENLDSVAQQMLAREWHKLAERDASGGLVPPSDGLCLLRKVLPEMVRLAEYAHDRPMASLEPEIRQRLLEGSFNDENGDTSCDEPEIANIDRDVQLIVRVLEAVRTEALACGYWSDAPVTPLMCG